MPGIGALEVVLEVPVLREDVVEGLVHHIVGGGVNKGRILVDESGQALVSSKRTDALICRIWMTSSRGILVLLQTGISGDLLPGNHVLRRAGNLMRPSQIQRARNLEAPTDFEHGYDVAEEDAFK